MRHPQYHAEPKVLGDDEIGRRLVDDLFHLGDLLSQRLFVEEPIGDIAVERIKGAEAVAGIRSAQILLHFPDDAAARHDERPVDSTRERNSLVAIGWLVTLQHTESGTPTWRDSGNTARRGRALPRYEYRASAQARGRPQPGVPLLRRDIAPRSAPHRGRREARARKHRSRDSAARWARSAPSASTQACAGHNQCSLAQPCRPRRCKGHALPSSSFYRGCSL